MILVDTNLLLRRASPWDVDRPLAIQAISALSNSGERLCVVPQTLYEYWAAATRPRANNGLGLTAAECHADLTELKSAFIFLPDHSDLYAEWELLVLTAACHGRISYDARIAAAMRTYGITRIVTFNGTDFSRFPGIAIVDPHSLSSPLTPPPAAP